MFKLKNDKNDLLFEKNDRKDSYNIDLYVIKINFW
jgi:hypothetical protein